MTIGRNDLCPCGSGKEREKCCHGTEDRTGPPDKTSKAQAYDAIAFAVRVDVIKSLIQEFGVKHLNREYTAFALNLCDKISLTPDLDILRGHKAIWAAAIVQVIARLNFLFDTGSDLVLTPALICSHFKTVKSTVGNRASQIQKICGIAPGAKGFCRQEAGKAHASLTRPENLRTGAGINAKQMKLFE